MPQADAGAAQATPEGQDLTAQERGSQRPDNAQRIAALMAQWASFLTGDKAKVVRLYD